MFKFVILVASGEIQTISAPAFAESVTEGDINWEKSKSITLSYFPVVQLICF